MRLIKKQNQAEMPFQKITFGAGPATVTNSAVPAWMEAAACQIKTEGPEAKIDIAQIEKAAFEKGFQQGQESALESAEKKLEAAMTRYADALLEIGSIKQTVYQQAESQVVTLALEVAKKIVHREVQVDREIVQTLIRVALARVAVKSPVTVRVSPADYDFVMEHRAALRCSGTRDGELVLVADKSVGRGGCLLETECGDIDARIEEEFREVEQAFFPGGN